jgi:LuxR family quorum sensing-dependent transcriptional regulator
MQGMEADWGRRALDCVDAIDASTIGASVASQFEKAISDLGFDADIIAGIPDPGQSLDQLTPANGWTSDWFELSARENLRAVDPIPQHGLGALNGVSRQALPDIFLHPPPTVQPTQ